VNVLGHLADAFLFLLQPGSAAFLVMGVFLGLAVGVLPGINTGLLMALVLPLTFYMDSMNAVIMLIAMYVGGLSGGLITATLMRIPGEPSAIMTTLDGYPMAKGGSPGRALGLGIATSLVGGVISWLALVTLSIPFVEIAVRLGPFERFALLVTALMLIASLSGGTLVKGLLSAAFGMLVALPGVDEASGGIRFDFGIDAMASGFGVLPVIMGVFAINQILADLLAPKPSGDAVEASTRGIFISARDYAVHGWNMLRSSVIGVWMGILPGAGPAISSMFAYSVAKNLSRHPERFGHGSEEGIVASESANNAVSGGTLIPVLTLGIPGGLADAILLSALTIHNLQPGPLLFENRPDVVYTIMASHLAAHFVMFVIMIFGCALFAKLMKVQQAYLYPIILALCIVGAYAVNNRMFDVWVMLAFGGIGLAIERVGLPLGPFALGFFLAPITETQLRAALMWSDGSILPLFTRPISLGLLLVAAAMVIWSLVSERRVRRRRSAPEPLDAGLKKLR